jgi:hypothetical protein
MFLEILERNGSRDFKNLNEGQISCQLHTVYEKTLRKVGVIIQVIVFLVEAPCSFVHEKGNFERTFSFKHQGRGCKDS